jgi:hypothetical protein
MPCLSLAEAEVGYHDAASERQEYRIGTTLRSRATNRHA